MADQAHPLAFHPAGISRRRALALTAASFALSNGACTRPPDERIYPRMPELAGRGAPTHYASAVLRDGHAIGVLIGTQEGRPIKVEGNSRHPSSRGGTDAIVQAAVLDLWDPDRSQAVQQTLGNADGHDRPPTKALSTWDAFEAAWRGGSEALSARAGEGLHLLTGPVSSPTLRAQLADWLQRWPRARWHQHAPLHDRHADLAARASFGRAAQPLLHVDRARCVVALASDPFSDGPGALRQAFDWSTQRRRADGGQEPATLFAVEFAPGLFGARADHRIALPPSQIDALWARVASRLLARDVHAASPASFEDQLVDALRRAGRGSLIVPGAALSVASHAWTHAVHAHLGSHAHTLDWIAPLAIDPAAGSLTDLLAALEARQVEVLVVLDCNPAYDAPLGAFEAHVAQVPFSVHIGMQRDETAQVCHWHLPLSHPFEQWSDARAHDGSATLIQPAIAPLYDTRSPHEIFALLAGDRERNGHRLVRRQWQATGDFEAFWREALRRGVVPDSAATPLTLPIIASAAPMAASGPATGSALTAVFAADPSALDGRCAHNAWLQELPRPFTKLTWDNALLVGPATAATLGIESSDVVQVAIDARMIEAPAWVLRGHAEGCVTLPLGYGRRLGGRIGAGIGFNAYRIRPDEGFVATVTLQRAGRRHAFSSTLHAIDAVGRDYARTLPPGAAMVSSGLDHASLYPAREEGEHAWAMAIDLDACIGCNACTIACQAENNIPVVGKEQVALGRQLHWIRVDRYELPETAGSIFQPVPCMHCENAPCELVCPVGATVHDSEGLNVQVYNRCIGTRFCSNNCPYKVRRFNFLQYADTETETLKAQRNPQVTVRQRGVMEKCTYCLQRIARARQHALASGQALTDGDVVTACQAACPTQAIHFGDLRDPQSDVVRARRSPRHYALLGELNTRPRTTYLARVSPLRKDT